MNRKIFFCPALLKKECLEQFRTGHLIFLSILFILFGIMNPALAKITPWLMKTMADSLEETGLTVTEVTVDAFTSWTQFYKNMPIALIVFLLMTSSIFVSEYQKGTLIPFLAKGLSRSAVVLSKAVVLLLLWSFCYLLCFGTTFLYNILLWEHNTVHNLSFAFFCYWLFGVLLISVLVLTSAFASSTPAVLLGTGAAAIACYLAGLFPQISEYIPVKLINGMPLLCGSSSSREYFGAIGITILLITLCMLEAIFTFQKRNI